VPLTQFAIVNAKPAEKEKGIENLFSHVRRNTDAIAEFA